MSRFGISRLRGISFLSATVQTALRLRALGAVLRTTLLAALNAHGVQRAADHVVPHTGQVLHTATANEHQRVLLQVVAHAGDVRRDLDPVGQPDASDLAERGIRLLRRLREDADADAALLRTLLQRRALRLPANLLTSFTDKLTDCRHARSHASETREARSVQSSMLARFRGNKSPLKPSSTTQCFSASVAHRA